jgi:hypothetical protein
MTFVPNFFEAVITIHSLGILCEIGNFSPPRRFQTLMDAKEKNLSSLERLLLGLDPPPMQTAAPLRKGETCPTCGNGILDYNGLLQLECPACGFVSGEGAGCT